MPVRITTTIDGNVTMLESVEVCCDPQELADWTYTVLCLQWNTADKIHVLVETWIDSDTEEQESSECGWK